MANKDGLTKRIAEVARGLCGKIDAMDDLMGTELHEYFTETSELDYVLCELLNVPPTDSSESVVRDYVHGRIEYDVMLTLIKEAQDEFDPDAHAEFLRLQEETYGGISI